MPLGWLESRTVAAPGEFRHLSFLAVWAVHVFSSCFSDSQRLLHSSPHSPVALGNFRIIFLCMERRDLINTKQCGSVGYVAVRLWDLARAATTSCRSCHFYFCFSWILITEENISCPALAAAGFGSWASRVGCC